MLIMIISMIYRNGLSLYRFLCVCLCFFRDKIIFAVSQEDLEPHFENHCTRANLFNITPATSLVSSSHLFSGLRLFLLPSPVYHILNQFVMTSIYIFSFSLLYLWFLVLFLMTQFFRVSDLLTPSMLLSITY